MNRMNQAVNYLKSYNGRPLSIMEVCGTHTSSIMKNGIREILSPKIRLVSGPGCPVCVTPSSYIDIASDYALKENHVLATFGDMMKVPGRSTDLYETRSRGGFIEIVYSPMDVLEKARRNTYKTYIMAAVGFETTAPIYALLVKKALSEGANNIKLLTAVKTITPALKAILREGIMDGFICPGHVCAITGLSQFEILEKRYNKPFTVAGFEGNQIILALYDLVHQIEKGVSSVHNLYPSVVNYEGNIRAKKLIDEIFMPADATWRGLGLIKGSGLQLKPEYCNYDVPYGDVREEETVIKGCRCTDVITGRISPHQCPMFGTACTPLKPLGACMVSGEGACGIWHSNQT